MLTRCIDIYRASGQQPADVFLWHQGESDCLSGMPPTEWIVAFDALVENLVEAKVLRPDPIVLAGGVAHSQASFVRFNASAIQAAMRRKGRVYVGSAGLEESDGMHFTGEALVEFGARRYYAAYKLAAAGL